MFGIKIPRPSPALVVAVLALLIALSGTAYAAVTLAPNSVGTAQLKNGAVTLTKIASSAQGALKPRAWAVVKSDGTVVASSGIVGYGRPQTGVYELTLSKPAPKCAAIASENPGHRFVSVTGGIAQANIFNISHPNATVLEVVTQHYGSGFAPANESFSVVVYC